MNKLILLFSAIAICLLFFISCRKKDGSFILSSYRTVTFKGRLVETCAEEPIANTQIVLRMKGMSITHNSIELGVTTTDDQGNFFLQKELATWGGTLFISTIKPGGSTGRILGGCPINTDGTTTDAGTLYQEVFYGAVFKIKINRQVQVTDTLFVGMSPLWLDTVFPIPIVYTQLFQWFGGQSVDSSRMYWGIGIRDYDSAYHFRAFFGGEVAPYHEIKFPVKACTITDTIFYDIN